MNPLTVYWMTMHDRGDLYDCRGEYVDTAGDADFVRAEPGHRAACMIDRDDVVAWLRGRDANGLAEALANATARTMTEECRAIGLAKREAERDAHALRHSVVDAARMLAAASGTSDRHRFGTALDRLIAAVRDCDAS